MQNKQSRTSPPSERKRNRYSKILIPVIGGTLALIAFVVGGTLAGWDILGWLKSLMAILIYVILGVVGVTVIYRKIRNRRY